jgi:hypothetical protein
MRFLFFYTDPGSGTMLLQLLLATVAGVGFYFRTFFYRLFGGRRISSADVSRENGEEERK